MARAAAVLALVSTLAFAACGTSSDTTSTSIAEQFATLEAHGSPDSSLVHQFEAQLQRTRQKCLDDLTRIGDYTVNSQKLLAKSGINESLLSILTHVNDSIPAGSPKQHCDGVFAAYVVLRTRGR